MMTLVNDVGFRELTGQSVHGLSDRVICHLLEELQPDPKQPPQGERDKALLKALKAELLRRTYRVVEQQKREEMEYKVAIAG
jgi:hypothetical protein